MGTMFTGGPLSYPPFFLAFVILMSSPAVGRAALEIASHDVFVDMAQMRTTFTLSFNQPPDFNQHTFQYFYDAEPEGEEVGFGGEDVVIVRGAEIRFGDTIPVRDSLNPTGEEFPNAEGWGAVLGE